MKRVFQVAAGLLTLLWSMNALAIFLESWRALRLPDERDYGEGIVLWQAAHVTDIAHAYHSINSYPYIVFHYPPLYHLLARLVTLLTGDLLRAGRAVSIASFLGICLMLAWLAWDALAICRNRLARLVGTLCAGLLGFTMSTAVWAYLMRVDAAATALAILGLLLYIRSRHRPILAYAATTIFVLSLYTKQVMIEAPLVCLTVCFFENPRLAKRLAAWAVSLGLSILLVLNWASGGLFSTNLFRYNQNPYTVSHLVSEWGRQRMLQFLVPLFIGVLILLWVGSRAWKDPRQFVRRWVRGSITRRTIVIFSGYLTIALIMTLMVGKEGSNSNYFLQVDAALTLLAGLFLGWVMEQGLRRNVREFAILAVAAGAFILQTAPAWARLQAAMANQTRPSSDSAIADRIEHMTGTVYSENMTILMRAGKEIPAEPAIITCLANASMWKEAPFVEQLRSRRFSGVVVSTSLDNRDRFTPAVASAIREAYPVVEHVGLYTLYLPAAGQQAGQYARILR